MCLPFDKKSESLSWRAPRVFTNTITPKIYRFLNILLESYKLLKNWPKYDTRCIYARSAYSNCPGCLNRGHVITIRNNFGMGSWVWICSYKKKCLSQMSIPALFKAAGPYVLVNCMPWSVRSRKVFIALKKTKVMKYSIATIRNGSTLTLEPCVIFNSYCVAILVFIDNPCQYSRLTWKLWTLKRIFTYTRLRIWPLNVKLISFK